MRDAPLTDDATKAVRAPAPRSPVQEAGAASIYTHVPFAQETSFLVVGERTNANGSKKFREAMLDGDLDSCLAMAREQVSAPVADIAIDRLEGALGIRVAGPIATILQVGLQVQPLVPRRQVQPIVHAQVHVA